MGVRFLNFRRVKYPVSEFRVFFELSDEFRVFFELSDKFRGVKWTYFKQKFTENNYVLEKIIHG